VKKNILLVEDDDTSAAILEHHLGRYGFNILRAKEGREALRIISETPVALLTLDVQMSGMNGFEFLKELRRTPGISNIPVIILTWDARSAPYGAGVQIRRRRLHLEAIFCRRDSPLGSNG